jgi:hypothetical protein
MILASNPYTPCLVTFQLSLRDDGSGPKSDRSERAASFYNSFAAFERAFDLSHRAIQKSAIDWRIFRCKAFISSDLIEMPISRAAKKRRD